MSSKIQALYIKIKEYKIKLFYTIKSILSSKAIDKIKKSVIFNILLVLVGILACLQIFFIFLPKKGTMFLDGTEMYSFDAVGKEINATLKTEQLMIYVNGDMCDPWNNLILEPKSNEALITVTENNEEMIECFLSVANLENGVTHEQLTDEPEVNIYMKGNDIYIRSKTGFLMEYADDVECRWSNLIAYEINPNDKFKILQNYETSFLLLTGDVTVRIPDFKNSFDGSSIFTDAKITIEEINKVASTSNGKLSIAYSPKTSEYSIIHRNVILNSKNSEISGEIYINNETKELKLNGTVDKAEIDGYNLFPTVLGWYLENVYAIPLTIISTIFGGVALVKKKMKS